MVFITGATGRVGRLLVYELIKRGEKVRALVRKESDISWLKGSNCELIYGDVTDRTTMEFALDNVTTIFHLASYLDTTDNPDLEKKILSVNIDGTKNVVDLCLRYKKDLIYLNSIRSFTNPIDEGIMTENLPFDTDKAKSKGIYDYSMAVAAQYVKDQVFAGLKVVTLHPTTTIGPYDTEPSIFGNSMISLIKNNYKWCIKGKYNFVDVRDVVEAIVKAYSLKRYGERYILSGGPLTMETYVTDLKEFTGTKSRTVMLNPEIALLVAKISNLFSSKDNLLTEHIAKMLQKNYTVDCSHAQKDMAFTPRPIKISLLDQYNWFKDNGYLELKTKS